MKLLSLCISSSKFYLHSVEFSGEIFHLQTLVVLSPFFPILLIYFMLSKILSIRVVYIFVPNPTGNAFNLSSLNKIFRAWDVAHW